MYEKDDLDSIKAPICCLGWASNRTDIASMSDSVTTFDDSLTLEEFVASAKGTTDTQRIPNLPFELAFMDVAGMLPKLSALPLGGVR